MYAIEVREHIMIAHSFKGELFGPAQKARPREYRELPAFAGRNTTTEFLSRHIFDAIANVARTGGLGPGSEGLAKIRVVLHESHVAKAWFEGPVARG